MLVAYQDVTRNGGFHARVGVVQVQIFLQIVEGVALRRREAGRCIADGVGLMPRFTFVIMVVLHNTRVLVRVELHASVGVGIRSRIRAQIGKPSRHQSRLLVSKLSSAALHLRLQHRCIAAQGLAHATLQAHAVEHIARIITRRTDGVNRVAAFIDARLRHLKLIKRNKRRRNGDRNKIALLQVNILRNAH